MSSSTTKETTSDVGSHVLLLLLPVHQNKLEVAWQGLYVVLEKLSGCNFQIQQDNKMKIYHTNLLKGYQERPANLVATIVIEGHDTSVLEAESMPHLGLTKSEMVHIVQVNPGLGSEKPYQTRALLSH